MPTITMDTDELRALMKSVVLEALDERHAQLHEEVEEEMEDRALVRAMEQAEGSPTMSVEEFYKRTALES